jgi:Ca2+-binding EF-hand superfamily protein
MNKRIEELAIQSGFKKYDKDDGLYSPYIEGEELNDELQEFAELIINECLKCFDTDHEGDVEYIKFLVKREFGVK